MEAICILNYVIHLICFEFHLKFQIILKKGTRFTKTVHGLKAFEQQHQKGNLLQQSYQQQNPFGFEQRPTWSL